MRRATVAMLLILALVAAALFTLMRRTYDGALTCIVCLNRGSERRLYIRPVRVWRSVKYVDPATSEARLYEQITGSQCSHIYVNTGFGISRFGSTGDGASVQGVGAHERIEAISATYDLFAMSKDVTLTRRTLRVIDLAYPIAAIMSGTITPEQRQQGLDYRLRTTDANSWKRALEDAERRLLK